MKKSILISILMALGMVSPVFTQPGTPDGEFGTEGIVATDFNDSTDYGTSLIIHPDGKIIVAGYAHNGTDQDIALVRYNSDGTQDATFGEEGKIVTAIGSADDCCTAAIRQPDGKLLLTGRTYNGPDYDIPVIRYLPDGELDNTFGTDGITTIDIGNDFAKAIALQQDGKILVAGYTITSSVNELIVLRLNTDGTPDSSFHDVGYLTTIAGESGNYAYSMALQQDEKIVVAGLSNHDTCSSLTIVRYLPDGIPDSTFDEDGILVMPVGINNDRGNSVIIQPDQKILVFGDASFSDQLNIFLARFTTDGLPDNTFGENGVVSTSYGDSNSGAFAGMLQPDGKIIAAGYVSNDETMLDFAMVRYHNDGTLDNTFGNGGKVTTVIGDDKDNCYAAALQPDGKIVLTGYSTNNHQADIAVVRYIASLNIGVVNFKGNEKNMLIYPNPVADVTNFEYELINKEVISIELFDMQGRSVQTFISHEMRNPGHYKECLRIEPSLTAGNYLLVISNDIGRESIRLSRY